MKNITHSISIILIVLAGALAPINLNTNLHIEKNEIFAQGSTGGTSNNSETGGTQSTANTDTTTNTSQSTGDEGQVVAADVLTKEHDKGGYLTCGALNIPCKLMNFLQLIFVVGGNVLVGVSAFFMDIFLSHSLQSSSYTDAGFIEQGWEIIRDLTNIVFIFALVYIAFKIVLGIGESDAKKRLIKVILIALTINFSLFISYAIIDASNILANVLYNKIEQKNETLGAAITNEKTTEDEEAISGKSASLAIAAKINPQKILTETKDPTDGQRVVLILMIGVINVTLIYVFLSVSFLFLGRTISLWFSAILAPLAFASITIPGMESVPYIGFQKWFSDLLKTAFMAPVFIFFLYLAVQFMDVDIAVNTGAGFINSLLNITVPMAAIVVLIITAKTVATSMASSVASTISNATGKAIGGTVALGAVAATGGLAAAGGIGGTVMSGIGKTVGRNKAWGQKLDNVGKGMRSMKVRSFDVGKIPGFGKALKNPVSDYLGKKVDGRSIRGAENKAMMAGTKVLNIRKNFGRETAESDLKAQQARQKERDGASNWQDKVMEENLARDTKNEMSTNKDVKDAAGNTVNFEADRNAEEAAFRNVLDNPDAVKKEEKDIKGLEKSLENLTATLNAAKATGSVIQISQAQEEVDIQKIVLDARKKGKDITKTEAEGIYASEVVMTGIDVKEYTKSTNKGTYGGLVTRAGSDIESYKSDYTESKKTIQEKEENFIKEKIKSLRADGKNKEATALAKKMNSILTDSEKSHKEGSFDKDKK